MDSDRAGQGKISDSKTVTTSSAAENTVPLKLLLLEQDGLLIVIGYLPVTIEASESDRRALAPLAMAAAHTSS